MSSVLAVVPGGDGPARRDFQASLLRPLTACRLLHVLARLRTATGELPVARCWVVVAMGALQHQDTPRVSGADRQATSHISVCGQRQIVLRLRHLVRLIVGPGTVGQSSRTVPADYPFNGVLAAR